MADSPELATTPTQELVHDALPVAQLAPLLSLQKAALRAVAIVSSRQSEGSTQSRCDPTAGPAMGAITIPVHDGAGPGEQVPWHVVAARRARSRGAIFMGLGPAYPARSRW